MRVALFHNTPSGGAKRAIYEWTRRLSTKHTIDVYTLSSADHDFCDLRPLVANHHSFDFSPKPLFQSPLGRLNQLQRWRDLNELKKVGQRIANKINKNGYDVVFAHTCMYTFAPAFLQFVQVPATYYLHEPLGRQFTRQFQRLYLKTTYLHTLINRFDPLIKLYNQRLATIQRAGIARTKRLLANSHFTRSCMALDFSTAIEVCYLGVDTDKFYPLAKNQRQNYILSVGELTPRKGFDFLVETLAHIPAQQRPSLRIACNMIDDQEKMYVQHLASQSGVNLQILSKLSADQLRLEYNRAQMCVYAPVLEPFGLVPLEAMACGTPVVGVREGGVQESIVHEQTGLLVARASTEFATAIQFLLANPSVAAAYGHNGRQHVLAQWTWEQAVARLEEQLNMVANQ